MAFHMVRGDLARSGHLEKRLPALANETNDSDIDLMMCDALAQQSFLPGDIEAAHRHAEQVFTRYDINKHRGL